MKRSILVLSLMVFIALLAAGSASAAGPSTGANYGYQYLTDSDGDGIPNCEDSDYTPPLDGTGMKYGKMQAAQTKTSSGYALAFSWNWRNMFMVGWLPGISIVSASGYGPGDGTGDGVGPEDGTGYGPGPSGTGDCDGTGPDGLMLKVCR